MYRLEFTINGLPKRTNNMKSNWRARMNEAQKWKNYVRHAVEQNHPEEPLKRAKLTLTRHSSQEPDFDGLVSGFKHIIDGLIFAKVIINDKTSNVGQPTYKWERAPINKGFITVLVEEDSEIAP